MNKPLQQGAQATYGQPMPSQTLMPPHNTTPSHAHNNHFALNVPNAGGANATTLVTGGGAGATQNYTTNNPPASSHPVAAGSTNTSFNTPPKVGTTTNTTTNIFGGGSANYSAAPATGQLDEKTSQQPQSNGTAIEAVRAAVANSGKAVEVNHSSPKKELPVAASPEKPRGSPEKPAATLPTVEVKVTEAKMVAGEPAQAVAAVVPNMPSPTLASPSTTTPSTISSPNPASNITPTKPDNPVTSAVAVTTTPPSTATSSTATSTDGAAAAKVDAEKSDKVVVDGCVTPVKETPPTSTSVPTVVVATTADSTTPVSPIKPKDQSTPTKPVSTMKLATTPRTPSRKVKEQLVLKTPKHETKVAAVTSSGGSGGGGGSQKSPSSAKGKRHRIRTQPYQSPIPELEIISKLTRKRSPRTRNVDEKLIIFYKNEFLAVRNSEGGFYVCQAVQNIYKHSAKIKIRWLSQDKSDKSGEMYTPDFYDFTDFDCILTNLNLVRMDKGKYRLPAEEKDRTDNILTRAIAVEKGDAAPLDDSLTEEHPDGLDVSLYKDEEQLNIKSRTGTKRKATSTTASSSSSTPRRSRATSSSPSKRRSAKSARLTPKKASATTLKTAKKTIASTSSPQVKATQRKATSTTSVTVVKAKTPTKVSKKKKGVTTPVATSSGAKAAISSVGRAERAKRRQDTSPQAVSASGSASVTKNSPVLDQKKAKMLAKVVKRSAISMKVATLPPKSNSKPVVKTSTATAAPSKKSTNKPAVAVLATRKTKRTRK